MSGRTHSEMMFGGVDGDTEVNGCAVDDQFTDIVYVPASMVVSLHPPPLLLPLPSVECPDIEVGGDEPLIIPCDPVVVA